MAKKKQQQLIGQLEFLGFADEAGTPLLPAAPAAEGESSGSTVGNLAREFGVGAVGSVKTISDFISPNNRVSQFLDEVSKGLESGQSPEVQAAKQKFTNEVAEAGTFTEEMKAFGRHLVAEPALAIAYLAGNIAVPMVGVTGTAAKAGAIATGKALARGLGDDAAKAAGIAAGRKAGTAAGAGLGASMSGGDAAGTAYEELTRPERREAVLASEPAQQLLASGMPEDQVVHEVATAAARKASVAPAALGAAFGATGLERKLAGGTGGGGRVRTGVVEALQQGGEEVGTGASAGFAAQAVDPSVEPLKGAGANFAQGAFMGGAAGAAFGGQREEPPAPIPAGPPPGPLARAAAIAAGSIPKLPAPAVGGSPGGGAPAGPAGGGTPLLAAPAAEPAEWEVVDDRPLLGPQNPNAVQLALGLSPTRSEFMADSRGNVAQVPPGIVAERDAERASQPVRDELVGLTPDVQRAQDMREAPQLTDMVDDEPAPEVPALPFLEPTPGQGLVVGPDGTIRRATFDEERQAEDTRAESEALGLTPDVRADQGRRADRSAKQEAAAAAKKTTKKKEPGRGRKRGNPDSPALAGSGATSGGDQPSGNVGAGGGAVAPAGQADAPASARADAPGEPVLPGESQPAPALSLPAGGKVNWTDGRGKPRLAALAEPYSSDDRAAGRPVKLRVGDRKVSAPPTSVSFPKEWDAPAAPAPKGKESKRGKQGKSVAPVAPASAETARKASAGAGPVGQDLPQPVAPNTVSSSSKPKDTQPAKGKTETKAPAPETETKRPAAEPKAEKPEPARIDEEPIDDPDMDEGDRMLERERRKIERTGKTPDGFDVEGKPERGILDVRLPKAGGLAPGDRVHSKTSRHVGTIEEIHTTFSGTDDGTTRARVRFPRGTNIVKLDELVKFVPPKKPDSDAAPDGDAKPDDTPPEKPSTDGAKPPTKGKTNRPQKQAQRASSQQDQSVDLAGPAAEAPRPSSVDTREPVAEPEFDYTSDPVNDRELSRGQADDTLVLIACSDRKAEVDGKTPLFDLYTGPTWVSLRKNLGAIPRENVFAFSGKHGFVPASFESDNYNERVSRERADAAVAESAALAAKINREGRPYKNVVIVGSGDYRRVFNAIVHRGRESGAIATGASVVAAETTGTPDKRGGNGLQMQRMNEFLRQANEPANTPAAVGNVGTDADRVGVPLSSPDRPMRFASGMSRPGDFIPALEAGANVGVEINELSEKSYDKIAEALAKQPGSHLFIDSGAFTLFKANERAKQLGQSPFDGFEEGGRGLDFDDVFRRYDALTLAVSKADREFAADDGSTSHRLWFVMPDVMGDQAASFETMRRMSDKVRQYVAAGSSPIVPLPLGEMSPPNAFREMVKILGRGDWRVGIPSAETAFSQEQLRELLAEVGDRIDSIHFLGAASAKNLEPRLAVLREAGFDGEVSADANVLRAKLNGSTSRAQAMRKMLAEMGAAPAEAKPDELPMNAEVMAARAARRRLIVKDAKEIAEALGMDEMMPGSWAGEAPGGHRALIVKGIGEPARDWEYRASFTPNGADEGVSATFQDAGALRTWLEKDHTPAAEPVAEEAPAEDPLEIVRAYREKFGKTPAKMDRAQFRAFHDARRAAEAAAAERLVAIAERDGIRVQDRHTSDSLMMTPEPGSEKQWRITRFLSDGTPAGHMAFNNATEAAESLLSDARVEPAEQVSTVDTPPVESPVAEEKPAKKSGGRVKPGGAKAALAKRDPFAAFIGEMGGVDIRTMKEITGETGRKGNRTLPGYGPMFQKEGQPLDLLASAAAERGILTRDEFESDTDNGGVNRLMEMIRRSQAGEVVQTGADSDSEAAGRAAERDEAELYAHAASLGIDTEGMDPETLAEYLDEHEDAIATDRVNALVDAAIEDARGDDPRATIDEFEIDADMRVALAELLAPGAADRAANDATDEVDFLGRIEEIIREHQQNAAADPGVGQETPGRQAGERGSEAAEEAGAGRDAAAVGQAEEASEPLLTAPTPAELAARADAISRTEAEARRRDAAPAPEDFLLTGSNRPADEARARGQDELFDGDSATLSRAKDAPRDEEGKFTSEHRELRRETNARRRFIAQMGAIAAGLAGVDAVAAPKGKATGKIKPAPTAEPTRAAWAQTPIGEQLRSRGLAGTLEWLAENGSTQRARGLAATLVKLVPDTVRVRVVKMDGAHGTTTIQRRHGEIRIDLDATEAGVSEETILHEAVHAAIMSRYDSINVFGANPGKFGPKNADEAIAQYVAVWREFREMAAADRVMGRDRKSWPSWLREPYADPDEFISYALSNPDFQAWLAARTYKGKTLWTRLKDAIKSFFGLDSARSPSWLDAAMQASYDVLDAAAEDAPNMEVSKAILDKRADATESSTLARKKLVSAVRHGLFDHFAKVGDVGLWDRTLGTPMNLALRNKHFARAFDAAQDYLDDIALYANRAANRAPGIVPKLEQLRDITKAFGQRKKLDAVGRALWAGTLAGPGADPAQGRVWTDAELRAKPFGLNDEQIKLYRQARAAIDQSLDDVAKSDILNYAGAEGAAVRAQVLDAVDVQAAAQVLLTHLANLAKTATPNKAARLSTIGAQVQEKADRVTELKAGGYAPLSRFGDYSVEVIPVKGTPGYKDGRVFMMFDSKREAFEAQRQWAADPNYKGAAIKVEPVAKERFKLFKGVSVETMELFGQVAGISQGQMFQDFLRHTKSNRSAMKRMIHRKGVKGYSEDTARVLAQFLTSNARATAANLNNRTMSQAAKASYAGGKDVGDEATKLHEFVRDGANDPTGKLRGLMFMQYLGGSIASAAVNMTQPISMTYPWLAQHVSTAQATLEIQRAMLQAATGRIGGDPHLKRALARAAEEGLTQPQEIHHLYAQTGMGMSRHPAWRGFTFLWGSFFSKAESFNRRATFIAAYRVAQQKKLVGDAAYAFAKAAVDETQGIYNPGNRSPWARTPIGAAALTFKQFIVSYLEFLNRLPVKQKALALGVLVLLAGLEELPFADDIHDGVDTAARLMGYHLNSKRAKREFIVKTFGKEFGSFLMHGVSTALPFDFSARLGAGNLVPGTGAFLGSTKDKTREIADVFGAPGSFIQDMAKAGELVAKGELLRAAEAGFPLAFRNVLKAYDMATTGMYRDSSGKMVINDVTGAEVAFKGIGFQPRRVAEDSRETSLDFYDSAFIANKKIEFNERAARAIFERDQAEVAAVKRDIATWNKKNPHAPIKWNDRAIKTRVKNMGLSRAERMVKRAPPEIREAVARDTMDVE